MSGEGQLSTNMQVANETSVNWGPLLGEESAQGNVPGSTDLSARGRSASSSPTLRGRTKAPNTVFCRGRSPTPRSKTLGKNIAAITEKLKRDFEATASQTQANLERAASTAESGQSIAQAAFQQTVERKKEIEHLHATRDVRGKEREKTGTGKKLERTRFFPFPFLQILTSAHLYCQLCAPISLSSETFFLFYVFYG